MKNCFWNYLTWSFSRYSALFLCYKALLVTISFVKLVFSAKNNGCFKCSCSKRLPWRVQTSSDNFSYPKCCKMHLSQWSLLIDIVQKFKFRFSKKAEKVWQNLPVLLWNYRNVRAKLEDFVIFLETRNFMCQFCLLYQRNLIHCIKLHILCMAPVICMF